MSVVVWLFVSCEFRSCGCHCSYFVYICMPRSTQHSICLG